MRLLTPCGGQENQAIAAWLAAELGVTFSEPFIALAILDQNGVMAGAVLLNEYEGPNVALSAAGRGAFPVSVIRALTRYVFLQLKCERVTFRTKRSNHRARRLLQRHFKPEGAFRRWYGEEDAFQFRMCRDECPWLERLNEQSIAAPAA